MSHSATTSAATSPHIFAPDGSLIGDFEGLYRSEPSPWGQDGRDLRLATYYRQSRSTLSYLANNYEGDVLEVGCGQGHALEFIRTEKKRFFGMDISKTAIRDAKGMYGKHIKFQVGDITKESVKKDIIILNECLWYVMHKMDKVLENCQCKYLIINQGFLKEQKFGREIIDGWAGLLKHLIASGYNIIHAEYHPQDPVLMRGVVVCTS
jgi:SAM-dependent methyltransferase